MSPRRALLLALATSASSALALTLSNSIQHLPHKALHLRRTTALRAVDVEIVAVRLPSDDDSAEEKAEYVASLVEDDEWNGLTMELTSVVMKAVEEDVKKVTWHIYSLNPRLSYAFIAPIVDAHTSLQNAFFASANFCLSHCRSLATF